LHNHTERSSF